MIDANSLKPFFDGRSHPDALGRELLPQLLQQAVDERAVLDSLSGGIDPIELPAGLGLADRPVNFRGKPILVVGQGGMQTGLKATRNVPYFLCYPAAHGLPDVASGRLRLHGAITDGHLNLSDLNWTDFGALNAIKFKWKMKLHSMPGEWSLRTVMGCGGSLDGTTATHNDITCIPYFVTIGGLLKVRLFAMQDGVQDYADFALPTSVGVNTENSYEVVIDGPLRTLKVDGQVIGTRTTAFNNPTRKPWEDIWVGARPAGGWPEGWAIESTIDGEVWDVAVYQGSALLAAIDLSDVDGLCVGVTSIYGRGALVWRQGDYAGDVQGAGVSGIRFTNGTFGLYAYGVHNAHLHDLSSFFCRYPLFLRGHSFQNRISDVNFQFARNGITATQISDCSIDNAQISYSRAFAVVSKESAISIRDSWFYGGTAGEVLAKDCKASVADTWTTDESGSGAPYDMVFVNCPSVELRSCLLFGATQPTQLLSLQNCKGGTLQNVDFHPHPSDAQCVRIEGAPVRKFTAQNARVNGSVPLTDHPEWINSLDVLV